MQTDFERVRERFDYSPHDAASFAERRRQLLSIRAGTPSTRQREMQHREQLVALLRRLHEAYGADEAAIRQLERLLQPETTVIVTGQQTGLWGGPLYTMYKAVTTIRLAKHAEQLTGAPVVPIFWLASQDHDYEEVRTADLLGTDGRLHHFRLADHGPAEASIADRPLPRSRADALEPGSVDDLLERLAAVLRDAADRHSETGYRYASVWLQFLRETAERSETLSEWTGRMMTRLFSKHGLVMFDPSFPGIAALAAPFYRQVLHRTEEIREAIRKGRSNVLQLGLPLQVDKDERHMHLFLRQENGARQALFADTMDTAALLEILDRSPERFSPDVLLRPQLQDELLPTLAYVAGPGELGYYAQMQELYRVFGRTMPVIVPRLSATLLRPHEKQQWLEWGGQEGSPLLRQRSWQAARDAYLTEKDAGGPRLRDAFLNWKRQKQAAHEAWLAHLRRWDGDAADTIGALVRATNRNDEQLFDLLWQIWEASQAPEELAGLRMLHGTLYPNEQLQERYLNVVPYLAEFGEAWLDDFVTATDLPVDGTRGEHLILMLNETS